MSTESNFSFTTKSPTGDLLTVRGDSYQEFVTNLMAANAIPSIFQLLNALTNATEVEAAAIGTVVQTLGGQVEQTPTYDATVAAPSHVPAAVAPQFAPVPPAAAPAAAPAAQGGKMCQHGTMVYRTGTNANTGKAWAGHFCPAPKGDPSQCKPVFGK